MEALLALHLQKAKGGVPPTSLTSSSHPPSATPPGSGGAGVSLSPFSGGSSTSASVSPRHHHHHSYQSALSHSHSHPHSRTPPDSLQIQGGAHGHHHHHHGGLGGGGMAAVVHSAMAHMHGGAGMVQHVSPSSGGPATHMHQHLGSTPPHGGARASPTHSVVPAGSGSSSGSGHHTPTASSSGGPAAGLMMHVPAHGSIQHASPSPPSSSPGPSRTTSLDNPRLDEKRGPLS